MPFFDSRLKQSEPSLLPTDEQQNGEAEAQTPSPSDPSPKQKWTPTPEAFEKLLARLSSDRNEAGERYEVIRLKLLRFFEWRCCVLPDDRVDETFNRVMRRIDEGQTIENLMAYFYETARFIFMESLKEKSRTAAIVENIPTIAPPIDPEPPNDEPRERCFDDCLRSIPVESRKLILGYYDYEKNEKIGRRKKLAIELDLPMNALRIRAHRIRRGLEKCVKTCLRQYGDEIEQRQ